MNELQVFKHDAFGKIGVLVVENKEYFPAIKAAKILGYANPYDAIKKHCREKGVAFHEVLSNGGTQQIKLIDEGNLYRLIVRSKLKEAEKFESWVFDEVLPTIRKTGGYVQSDKADEFVNSWLPQLDETSRKAIAGALEENKALRNENKTLVTTIESQRSKVLFANAYEVSEDLITIKEMANLIKQKGIDTGEKRFYRWLRDNGYVCKKLGSMHNLPTQRSLDLGVLEIKKGFRTGTAGAVRQTKTTKVTGKGQLYFINKFLGESEVI